MLKLISKNNLKKIIRNPRNAIAKGKSKIITQVAASYLKGYSPFPQNLTFFLTYRCNLRCNVCGQWGDTGYVKDFSASQMKDEVEISTLKRVIAEISPYKPRINLCGGEVLLYKDWFKFLSFVKSKHLECFLTTNGTMLEENAEKIVDLCLDKISLSLDGPEKIHNIARGVGDNVFKKAIRGIESINRYKNKKTKRSQTLK
ncbi:Fe-S oxidoreductase [Candidatus Scalindua japonica]|uniref:Fe-S oxidoreductase n=1 Tax=Candidatus Scalindua japonica TaxID=1284222 RepID=A0A286TTJ7_9BACT|nr:radical SAM protein [Candidatus Scalindua japonica]GAX59184.1 Fe-S oxidoreductase [Candidatus Scalindua japonica]